MDGTALLLLGLALLSLGGAVALFFLWPNGEEARGLAEGRTPAPLPLGEERGGFGEEAAALEIRPGGAVLHFQGGRLPLRPEEVEALLAQARPASPEQALSLRARGDFAESASLFLLPLAATQGLALLLPHLPQTPPAPEADPEAGQADLEAGGGEKGSFEVGGAG